jgi:hypothetical protein
VLGPEHAREVQDATLAFWDDSLKGDAGAINRLVQRARSTGDMQITVR